MRRLVPVCCLSVLAVTAGCGSSPSTSPSPQANNPSAAVSAASSPDAAAVVVAASTKTLDRKTSRVATTVVSSAGLRLQSSGVYDFGRGNAVVDIITTTSGRTSKQHMVLVSGVAYVNVPGLGTGGKYIKLNLSALTGRSGGSSFDQNTQLNLLRGATESLRPVGTEAVRGVATTHYSGILDQRKALAAIPDAKQRAAVTKLTSLVKTPNRLPVELWIDGNGLLRRQKQTVPVPAQKVSGVTVPASTVTTTSELYDFGVPVTAVAPPASAVLG